MSGEKIFPWSRIMITYFAFYKRVLSNSMLQCVTFEMIGPKCRVVASHHTGNGQRLDFLRVYSLRLLFQQRALGSKKRYIL